MICPQPLFIDSLTPHFPFDKSACPRRRNGGNQGIHLNPLYFSLPYLPKGRLKNGLRVFSDDLLSWKLFLGTVIGKNVSLIIIHSYV